jgi:hypothetical protein
LQSFTAAHLKTVDQRRLGSAYDWRGNRSNQELIAIHRSAISRAQGATLFFSLSTFFCPLYISTT